MQGTGTSAEFKSKQIETRGTENGEAPGLGRNRSSTSAFREVVMNQARRHLGLRPEGHSTRNEDSSDPKPIQDHQSQPSFPKLDRNGIATVGEGKHSAREFTHGHGQILEASAKDQFLSTGDNNLRSVLNFD